MKIQRRWLCSYIGALCLFPSLSAAQTPSQDAPLGLSWGISSGALRDSGVELSDFQGTDFGKSFIGSKIDKALADQSAALLSFGFNDKLWRIVITSRNFTDDPTGSAVLARYNELSSVLSEKYGKPKEVHRLGDSIYAQQRYFVAGINGGKSSWFSNFETPTLFIQLGVTASDGSTSGWRLIYENKALKKEFDASKRLKEKGTL
jgi:hypothetical protein